MSERFGNLACRALRRDVSCGVAEHVKAAVQRVASKAQDAGRLASVLGASALLPGLRYLGQAAPLATRSDPAAVQLWLQFRPSFVPGVPQ